MTPKPKKVKAPKEPKPKREGPHHRAAQLPNDREFACPECWQVPATIRTDGVTLPRHLVNEKPCTGQGRTARHVIDDPWEFGTAPKVSISALEFINRGTTRIDEKAKREADRQAKREAKAAKAPRTPKEPRTAKPKAEKPKSAPKAPKAKPRNRKAKTSVSEEKLDEAPAAA